ncbi:MAG: carbohydrate kinase [Planctomycetota bacterium]|nr:carbohydrate kinase [Planctomycetota bacterium]
MNKENWNSVAIDCGNSSIRVVVGEYDGEKLRTTLVRQMGHKEIQINGCWFWDILAIFNCIKEGLREAYARVGHIHSAGISTWGIDYGLLGEGELLLANPLCHRNSFGEEGLSALTAEERRELFDQTGIHCDKINTVFQILGYRRRFPVFWRNAKALLLIPDLLNYFLTGEKNTDTSIVSTSQLFDVTAGNYAAGIFKRFDIDPDLLPPLCPHGKVRGTLRPELVAELGINSFPVVSVPGHDTAAAVAAIPTDSGEKPLFISSGTWSLIGVELPKPMVNAKVFQLGLTNEAGALGTTTLLKNSVGLFIAQRLRQEFGGVSEEYSPGGKTAIEDWNSIVAGIKSVGRPTGIIDPNDPVFFNPPSMREAISTYLRRSGQRQPAREIDYFRVVYDSLALSYRAVVESLTDLGIATGDLHIIGGGCQNHLLNQITADLTGRRVVVGPVEATSLGVLAMELLHPGIASDLAAVRKVAATAGTREVYESRGRWDNPVIPEAGG